MREQKRSRRVAMTPSEVDDFLAAERTCRVATTNVDGRPHVVPLWFVWHDRALWLTSLVRSQRWTALARDPRVAVVVGTRARYGALRGGASTGPAPPGRGARPPRRSARKSAGGDEFPPDGRHGWLRVDPDKMVSWDFRKIQGPGLR